MFIECGTLCGVGMLASLGRTPDKIDTPLLYGGDCHPVEVLAYGYLTRRCYIWLFAHLPCIWKHPTSPSAGDETLEDVLSMTRRRILYGGRADYARGLDWRRAVLENVTPATVSAIESRREHCI